MSHATVEVAHEALLREWPRLRAWLEEDRQGHQLRQHLTQASKQWQATQRDDSELYRGARLSAALDWAATRGPDLNELERSYLAESRQASERGADSQRRANRRLRGLLVGTAVFLVVALVAGGFALVQQGRAQDEAVRAEDQAVRAEDQVRIASARELAAAANANLDVDPQRSILLALEAVDATWETDGTVVPEAEEALHHALQESRLVRTMPQGHGVAVTADGSRFATTGQDGTAKVWETSTGDALLTLRGHEGEVNGIAFSPDGALLATTGSDRTVRLWNGETGRRIRVLRGHRKAVGGPAFSPDGKLLATSSDDGTVRLWGVGAGTRHLVLKGPPASRLRSGPLLPSHTGLQPRRIQGRQHRLARDAHLGRGDGRYREGPRRPHYRGQRRGVQSRRPTRRHRQPSRRKDVGCGDRSPPWHALGSHGPDRRGHLSPDGTRIATGSDDGTARVWDVGTGESLLLAGHTIAVQQVAFNPDGDRLLTAGADGTARLWTSV